MADVRDGEIITLRGLPPGVTAYRHPDGVYLWDATRNKHAFTGLKGDGVAPALINMGHGDVPWVKRWAVLEGERLRRERITEEKPLRAKRITAKVP